MKLLKLISFFIMFNVLLSGCDENIHTTKLNSVDILNQYHRVGFEYAPHTSSKIIKKQTITTSYEQEEPTKLILIANERSQVTDIIAEISPHTNNHKIYNYHNNQYKSLINGQIVSQGEFTLNKKGNILSLQGNTAHGYSFQENNHFNNNKIESVFSDIIYMATTNIKYTWEGDRVKKKQVTNEQDGDNKQSDTEIIYDYYVDGRLDKSVTRTKTPVSLCKVTTYTEFNQYGDWTKATQYLESPGLEGSFSSKETLTREIEYFE